MLDADLLYGALGGSLMGWWASGRLVLRKLPRWAPARRVKLTGPMDGAHIETRDGGRVSLVARLTLGAPYRYIVRQVGADGDVLEDLRYRNVDDALEHHAALVKELGRTTP